MIFYSISDNKRECLEDIHCKRGYICNPSSKSCTPDVSVPAFSINLNKENDLNCQDGWEVVEISNKMVCRKICPYNWKDATKFRCGVHQFCKEEFQNISISNSQEDKVIKSNNTARFYCETPRCDENDQVRVKMYCS